MQLEKTLSINDSEREKTILLVIIFSILVNVVAWLGPLLGGSCFPWTGFRPMGSCAAAGFIGDAGCDSRLV